MASGASLSVISKAPSPTTCELANNFTQDLTNATAALFVNLAGGDPHLAATASAAINHGTTLADCTTDLEGQARPSGTAYDIGADEFGAPNRRKDFNGDRKADVLFWHPSGGDVSL